MCEMLVNYMALFAVTIGITDVTGILCAWIVDIYFAFLFREIFI